MVRHDAPYFCLAGSKIIMNEEWIMERYIRAIAGSFVLLSVLLAHVHSLYWLFFTAFVGLNLLQSAFTKWCPLEILLGKLGVPRDNP